MKNIVIFKFGIVDDLIFFLEKFIRKYVGLFLYLILFYYNYSFIIFKG